MRRRNAVVVACLFIGALLPSVQADDPSPEPPADVVCTPLRLGGTWSAVGDPTGVVLRITGAGYNGNATLAFKSATPSRLRVRFVGVRNMQTFTLSDGRHSYQAS